MQLSYVCFSLQICLAVKSPVIDGLVLVIIIRLFIRYVFHHIIWRSVPLVCGVHPRADLRAPSPGSHWDKCEESIKAGRVEGGLMYS